MTNNVQKGIDCATLDCHIFIYEKDICMNCDRCPLCCSCVDVQCTANNCGEVLEPFNEFSMHDNDDKDIIYARYYCPSCKREHRVTFAPIAIEQDH